MASWHLTESSLYSWVTQRRAVFTDFDIQGSSSVLETITEDHSLDKSHRVQSLMSAKSSKTSEANLVAYSQSSSTVRGLTDSHVCDTAQNRSGVS
jgi:hypothetical protein